MPFEWGSPRRCAIGAGDVADELVVRHATLRARRGGRVVGTRAGCLTPVEVGDKGGVAVSGELARDLLGSLVVAGHVVDNNDRSALLDVGRKSEVGLDLVVVRGP